MSKNPKRNSRSTKNNKNKSIISFILILAVILSMTYVLFNGLSVGVYEILPVSKSLTYGLDLTGGVYVVLEAKDSAEDPVTDEKIERAIATIRERIDNLGVSEPVITKQGNKRIRVSIPSLQDQDQALELIGKTAQLEFIDPDGNVVINGSHVEESLAVYQTSETNQKQAVVTLKLNKEGSAAFAQATETFINQVIEIKLDGEVISSPMVETKITGGEAVITGMKDIEAAGDLAMLIQAGALPVELEAVETRTIGPTLGQESLDKSVIGGLIGISLVMLFMLIFYKIPGLIANLALTVYILLNFLVMVALGVTITLPGIAGTILSVGMAVDANVIIFERIKEELRLGKSLMASIDAGFTRAFTSIIDGNLTTVIAGIVLFVLGTGTVRGFAVNLIIGVVISLFTALAISKNVLKIFVKAEFVTNTKLYGAKEGQR